MLVLSQNPALYDLIPGLTNIQYSTTMLNHTNNVES